MRTYRNRLLVLIIGLVVVGQTVTLLAVLARTSDAVEVRAAEELLAGATVAKRLIDFRAQQLSNAVGVLAADFGLREAVATADAPTILSAAANHGRRIGADLLLVLDNDGKLVVSSHGETSLDPRISQALMQDSDSVAAGGQFVRLGEDTFQVLSAAVRAPQPVGRVAIGFRIDEALALEVQRLVDVDIAFFFGTGAEFDLVADTQGGSLGSLLPAQDALRGDAQTLMIGNSEGKEYLATLRQLASGTEGLSVALLKPMQKVRAPFVELRNTLWGITAIAALLATAVGVVLGRAAVRPIDDLVVGAQRVERGEYGGLVKIAGGAEFERLANTFNAMQMGIAERETRITHQAHHDSLTGLPNRQRMETQLNKLLDQVRSVGNAKDPGVTAVILEVVNLREFSGSLGFEFADQLLLEIARRLKDELSPDALLAKLEGGRFGYAVPSASAASMQVLAEKIDAALHTPVRVGTVITRLTIATGIATSLPQDEGASELLRKSETALYDALARGCAVAVFDPQRDQLQQRRLRLSADLPEAIDAGRLRLVYQPKVALRDRACRSAEVLVRWNHADLGVISPAEFVPLAEQTGAAALLTRWVLRQSLRQLAIWHADGLPIDVAVNLSAVDIVDPGLPDFVLEQLRLNKLPATALLLEITESAVMRDVDAAARHMQLLRHAGVRFAIDDFGTGYSSLSQLSRLPVDELKIDKSFVIGAVADDGDAAIVRSTVELGHTMGLRIVAEGVETVEHWQLLARIGCDFAQGYLISRPLDAEAFTAYMAAEPFAGMEADSAAVAEKCVGVASAS